MGLCVRPLLCGYYGEHNIGDDVLLEALLQQLPTDSVPLVTAYDQHDVQRRFAVDTCPRRSLPAVLKALARCDALVLGGGSLLQDSTSFKSLLYYAALIVAARVRRRPVLLWAQGLGPLRRRRSQLVVRALLPMVQGITWRDRTSARLAAGWGVEAAVGADPVWSLPGVPGGGNPSGPIVVCWRNSHQLDGRRWLLLLQALDQLAATAAVEVVWLPFHRDQDTGLLQRLRDQGLVPPALSTRSRECNLATAEACQALFARASLVLAMRLHGLILAALSGSPCVALSYDPKVSVAAEALGCPVVSLDGLLEGPPPASLAQSWLCELGGSISPDRVAPLREATAVHAHLLARWLANGPLQEASPNAT